MTRDELNRRRARYDRASWIAGAVGAAPFLSVYFLLHTPYLRAFLPESKLLSLVILFFVPLAWFFVVTRLYRHWGARWFGLQCPGCGAALADAGVRRGVERDACRACGSEFEDRGSATADA
jgi:hypothetical protein